nr:hypothetical protein [Tanacetum cinerariifolium]
MLQARARQVSVVIGADVVVANQCYCTTVAETELGERAESEAVDRLQRLYKSSHTAKEMTWHATGKCTEPDKMQHPVDGRAWKNFDTNQAYSMWPMILTTYNLHPWLCMKESSFTLTLLIPGPKSPGKDIDVYLRPLIDDLKVLWALKGKTAYVGHRRFLKKPHKLMRALEFNGEIENGDPLRKFDRDQIQAQLARLLTRVKGKHLSYGGVKIKHLKRLGIRSGLWLGQTKYGKCSKPQATYSFTPENRKKFCQFIKGVKLPDGFKSNFKHKVTDNDTNITGLKSHDCHIIMQRLLPYGLQKYLPDEVAKPIIKLWSFFKQICSATLMDDMLKAQSKVVDIFCNLELIYPLAFFDIMIHLVIYLPLEALECGPIRPRWMFSFERFMTKLKGYVQNKAKPKGSIAEGYVAEEALTFSSHYFWDVTTKFNRPDRNVDPPPPTCQFQIRQCHVDNDPGVSATDELFALACGPTPTPILVNSCVVNGVRFVVHSRDECHTTQNSDICSPGGRTENVLRRQPHWKVVEHVNHKKFSDGGVVVVEEDHDVIHFDKSYDLSLSTSLNDLDNATLHIDGQSTEVDAPPDIIDLDEDDDISDDEDVIPHDLADSDDEDLVNVDDDDGMSADVARGHGGDSGGDDRPLTHHIPTGCGGCFAKRGDHASHWSNYLGELIREMPLYYPSWQKVPVDRKAAILTKIRIRMPSLPFGMIPGTKPEPLKNGQNQAKEHGRMPTGILVTCSPSRSDDRELIHSRVPVADPHLLRDTHYWRGIRAGWGLSSIRSNTETGVPYTKEEIMDIVRKGKQRGHLPGFGRELSGLATGGCPPPPQSTVDPADVEKLKKGLNESGGCGDDEPGGDENDDEDEEDEEDGDS